MSTLRGRPAGAMLILGGLIYLVLLAAALIWLHLSPEIALALTLAGIGIPVCCIRPVIGLHVFLLAFYLETAFGEDAPVMKVIGVAVLAGWLLNVAIRRSTIMILHPLVVVIASFVLWCGLTAINAEDSHQAMSRTFQFVQMGVATLMFSAVLDTTRKIRAFYCAIVLWVTVSTLIAVFMYYLGMTPIAQGFMHNRNLLATHINIATISAYVLFQTSRTPITKGVLLATLPVFFLGLALTLSRTGLVALVLALGYVVMRLARERGYLVIGSTLAALCLVSFVLPDAFWHRAGTILPAIERQEDTFGLRVKIWKVGLEMIQDHPIAGVGAGNFLSSFGRYAHGRFLWRHLSPHNAFVGVGAEMGLVGLGLFISVLLLALSAARQGIRSGGLIRSQDLRSMAVVAEVSLLALIVSCCTGDVEDFKLLWIMIGLALSLSHLGQEAVKSHSGAEAVRQGDPVPVHQPGWGLVR